MRFGNGQGLLRPGLISDGTSELIQKGGCGAMSSLCLQRCEFGQCLSHTPETPQRYGTMIMQSGFVRSELESSIKMIQACMQIRSGSSSAETSLNDDMLGGSAGGCIVGSR